MKRGYREWSHVFLHCTQKVHLMANLPPELGSPDVWAGGGVGLIAGLLLRYFIVRVFIVFRLFGREWSFDLKDRGREDNHTEPR